jgi:hypothetical protein
MLAQVINLSSDFSNLGKRSRITPDKTKRECKMKLVLGGWEIDKGIRQELISRGLKDSIDAYEKLSLCLVPPTVSLLSKF